MLGQPRWVCGYYAFDGSLDTAIETPDDILAVMRCWAADKGYELQDIYVDDHSFVNDNGVLYRLLYDIVRYKVKCLVLYDEFNALSATDKELVEFLCVAHYCAVEYVVKSDSYVFA
ncbi:hypothetical protein FACS189490_05530 [Clostridia bacterium]|nr:hypothetical protein FACS189490_05530 [Clostridia bacterium]